jgi:hypothetical protein
MPPRNPSQDEEPVEDLAEAVETAEATRVELSAEDEGLDPNHPILTIEEQRAARATAQKEIAAEARKAAIKDLVAKEKAKLGSARKTGDPIKDEMVDITLDLAPYMAADKLHSGIKLDGVTYLHGHTYTVARHIADTLRDIQWNGWKHDNEINGKGLADRARLPSGAVARNTTLSGVRGVIAGMPQANG